MSKTPSRFLTDGLSHERKRLLVSSPLPVLEIEEAFLSQDGVEIPGKQGLWIITDIGFTASESADESGWRAYGLPAH